MRWWRILFALALVFLFAWAVWEGRNWRLQTKLTPWAIGIPVTVLAAVVVVQELWPRRRETGGAEPKDAVREAGERALEQELTQAGGRLEVEPAVARRRTAAIVGWILGFFLAIVLLGFHLGVPLMAFLYLRFGGRESWLWTILITVGAWASVDRFFDCVIHVYFESGLLAPWYEPLFNALPYKLGALFLPGC